ncbi:MAG TPA: outer membrane beta-barrel protein [Candidatus Eisenbacteria bacterium]|nr:outer membrane beta-barrel protein [Candidatus Eisenbacteria bacterium]
MKRIVFLLVLGSLVASVPAATAASDLGFKRIGATLGYIDPEGLGGTFSFGVIADHGTIAPKWGLESRFEYWSSSESAFGAEASIRDVALGARTKYYFPIQNPRIRPFAGAGLGMHFLKAKVTVVQPGFPPMTAEGSQTELGLDLGGGVAHDLGPRTDLLGEVWFGMVDTANTFSLRVGLSRQLGH